MLERRSTGRWINEQARRSRHNRLFLIAISQSLSGLHRATPRARRSSPSPRFSCCSASSTGRPPPSSQALGLTDEEAQTISHAANRQGRTRGGVPVQRPPRPRADRDPRRRRRILDRHLRARPRPAAAPTGPRPGGRRSVGGDRTARRPPPTQERAGERRQAAHLGADRAPADPRRRDRRRRRADLPDPRRRQHRLHRAHHPRASQRRRRGRVVPRDRVRAAMERDERLRRHRDRDQPDRRAACARDRRRPRRHPPAERSSTSTPTRSAPAQAFYAGDTGGAIIGRHVDIYDWQGRAAQYAWGARQVTVTAAPNPGTGPLLGEITPTAPTTAPAPPTGCPVAVSGPLPLTPGRRPRSCPTGSRPPRPTRRQPSKRRSPPATS